MVPLSSRAKARIQVAGTATLGAGKGYTKGSLRGSCRKSTGCDAGCDAGCDPMVRGEGDRSGQVGEPHVMVCISMNISL